MCPAAVHSVTDMCPAAVHSVTLNVAYVLTIMRNVSTGASIFLNFYMIRHREHQHCCHFVGEKKSVLNNL